MTREEFLNKTALGKDFKQAKDAIACVDNAELRLDLYDALEVRLNYEVANAFEEEE